MEFKIEAINNKTNSREVIYVDSSHKEALADFSSAFYNIFKEVYEEGRQVIVLCIGTDRVTGDSLGPMIGYKLDQYKFGIFGNIGIYGTLNEPVHAKNLKFTIDMIYEKYDNPLVIAIDASLGSICSIGHVTVGKGPLKPGAGVNKKLPIVGDMFVTGIVNISVGFSSIQNTRLGLVMQMADIIFYGMVNALSRIKRQKNIDLEVV